MSAAWYGSDVSSSNYSFELGRPQGLSDRQCVFNAFWRGPVGCHCNNFWACGDSRSLCVYFSYELHGETHSYVEQAEQMGKQLNLIVAPNLYYHFSDGRSSISQVFGIRENKGALARDI